VGEVIESVLRSGQPRATEVEIRHLRRACALSAVPFPGEAGAPHGVVLTFHDVTERRRVDHVRRDFVANASHELKTPVASLQALAETIGAASVDDPEAVPRFASQLEQEAIRLGRVVSDLLDLSRLEGASGVPQEVRLDRIVADELGRVEERAREASLQTGLRDRAPTLVRGSPRDLSLMVRNLLENAVQYTQPGGRVDVSVLPVDGEAVIEVKDSGIGIPARDRARVFERFYRVDRGRSRQTGGTGLGLSIVKHVAENHGGRVELESALGVGSTFIVRLPLASTGSPREAPESVGSIDRST
jgi:signal transduction histidine kinase